MQHDKERIKETVARCPACEARIVLGRKLRIGQTVVCPTCNERTQVAWLDPVELDWVVDEDDADLVDW